MTNRAYDWQIEGEREAREAARAPRGYKRRHARTSRLGAWVITTWAAIKAGVGA